MDACFVSTIIEVNMKLH